MSIKIFADGADLIDILEMNKNPLISGFTTNPTLMKKAGVTNYEDFAKEVLFYIKDKPISFEVLSDDFEKMYLQAKRISSWGENVYVKIPITNTHADSSLDLIRNLVLERVKVNVTAITTEEQIIETINAIEGFYPAIISIFAGRIADLRINPEPMFQNASYLIKKFPNQELLWASPREAFNLIQAERSGAKIITMSPDLIKKLSVVKTLQQMSLDTVKMFFNDAVEAGYEL
jgi:transaldolase